MIHAFKFLNLDVPTNSYGEPNIYHDHGDAIRGERVTAQYRKISKARLVHGTSSDQIRQAKLEGTVFCIIDKPLRYRVQK